MLVRYICKVNEELLALRNAHIGERDVLLFY